MSSIANGCTATGSQSHDGPRDTEPTCVRSGIPRLIAFYLPQYHPIPENDRWWEPGFTEWTNVVKARPLFPGHYQPHLPAHLGFYDLRLPETRWAQAELARRYGIDAFCYYHYWFNGRRLLERPFNEVLTSGEPDLPFCLCWANENWTRGWDGHEHHVLLEQEYDYDDDRRHIDWLLSAFEDPRYVRIGGKPVFLVYRARRLPDPRRTTDLWRERAHQRGVGEILLLRVESFPDDRDDPAEVGFDAAVEFQPDWRRIGRPLGRGRLSRVMQRVGLAPAVLGQHRISDYSAVVELMLTKPDASYLRYPCVTPGFDNSARRSVDATILRDSSPHAYQRWLTHVVERTRGRDDHVVFINAWNEWAEGNHLEPCQRWGLGYLEATKAGKSAATPPDKRASSLDVVTHGMS